MSIVRINRASCDMCGKKYDSRKTQNELLAELKAKGWKGNVKNILCPDCAGEKFFSGKVTQICNILDKYYVKVVNPAMTVYIDYGEFAKINVNSLPNLEHILKVVEKDGYRDGNIKYFGTSYRSAEKERLAVAHYAGGIDEKNS